MKKRQARMQEDRIIRTSMLMTPYYINIFFIYSGASVFIFRNQVHDHDKSWTDNALAGKALECSGMTERVQKKMWFWELTTYQHFYNHLMCIRWHQWVNTKYWSDSLLEENMDTPWSFLQDIVSLWMQKEGEWVSFGELTARRQLMPQWISQHNTLYVEH